MSDRREERDSDKEGKGEDDRNRRPRAVQHGDSDAEERDISVSDISLNSNTTWMLNNATFMDKNPCDITSNDTLEMAVTNNLFDKILNIEENAESIDSVLVSQMSLTDDSPQESLDHTGQSSVNIIHET